MLNINALSRSYVSARSAEAKSADKVDAFLIANYPAAEAKDDRKAFERKVMLPYEMARVLEKGGAVKAGDGVKEATAFMLVPGYASKPEGDATFYNAYRAAITQVGRMLERAGVTERAATRKDKGETKGKRAARAAAKAVAGGKPGEGETKPAKVVATGSNIVAPRLKAGEGVAWSREIAALIQHAGKKNADLTGDDGEAFRAFVAGVAELAKALPAKK